MSEYTILRPDERCEIQIDDGVFADQIPYAMAYVRMQRWERPMRAEDALACGTAFRRLVMPFGAMEVER